MYKITFLMTTILYSGIHGMHISQSDSSKNPITVYKIGITPYNLHNTDFFIRNASIIQKKTIAYEKNYNLIECYVKIFESDSYQLEQDPEVHTIERLCNNDAKDWLRRWQEIDELRSSRYISNAAQ